MAEQLQDIELYQIHRRILARERRIRDRTNPFLFYDDKEFLDRFRMSKESVIEITNLVGDSIVSRRRGLVAIPAIIRVLITLRFMATGSFLRIVGDTFGITSKILKRVSRAMAFLRRQFVNFPGEQGQAEINRKFLELTRIQGVVGAIDCTHVPIISPGGDDAELYRKRKGFFSINVQGICDTDLKFTNVVARWPGSAHDSRIFENSEVSAKFKIGEFRGRLLGDNGYPLKEYLLTPVLNLNTAAQRRYNAAPSRGRVKIENSFGVLKRRFPCLSLDLRLKLGTALCVIVACFALHNYCRIHNIPEPDVVVNTNNRENVNALRVIDRRQGGRGLRNIVIRTFE